MKSDRNQEGNYAQKKINDPVVEYLKKLCSKSSLKSNQSMLTRYFRYEALKYVCKEKLWPLGGVCWQFAAWLAKEHQQHQTIGNVGTRVRGDDSPLIHLNY
ncbi:uncharacterized protein LOC125501662 [Athalia rosae]|uniref:uncharacterized protein LOC125501662 n=1 Tax=Athalia rosae TaxID=37344 RepID=UPI002033860B|nr:uncharacterized protein LOC125501662 [Athalia rosae]